MMCPEIDFVIAGSGTDIERIQLLSSECSNLTLLGQIPWPDLIEVYKGCNVLWGQLAPSYGTAVPSKLYEYISAGRPVIFGADDVSLKIHFNDFSGVKFIKPLDAELLAEAVREAVQTSIGSRIVMANRRLIKQRFLRDKNSFSLLQKVNHRIRK